MTDIGVRGRSCARRPSRALRAVDQQIAAVRNRECLERVLLHHHDVMPSAVQALDQPEQVGRGGRREPGRRLIEQQQPRRRPSAPSPSRASGAGRRRACAPPARGARRAAGSARARPACARCVRAAVDIAAHLEVRLDGERGKDVRLLRHEGDAQPRDLARLEAADRLALEADRAFARLAEIPRSTLSRVDLPAPFGPISTTSSRSATEMPTPFSTSSCAP